MSWSGVGGTEWQLAALVTIAVVDAAFSGLRAGLGRDGLVDHRRADRRGALHGVTVLAVLLLPVAVVGAVLLAHGLPAGQLGDAASSLLAVYAPFAVVVATGLLCYRLSPWRYRFLAAALLLGPFTWVRPSVAGVGLVVLACRAGASGPAVVLGCGVLATLAVEPVVNVLWHRPSLCQARAEMTVGDE